MLPSQGREPTLRDKYNIVGTIGEGTYGIVFKAQKYGNEDAGKFYAIKVVKSHKEGKHSVVFSPSTLREVKLLRELNHENIVSLIDVHMTPVDKELALVFDYAEHDLRHLILHAKHTYNGGRGPRLLPEFTIKSLTWQVLKGMHYLHENWVMHRDMKPQNILVVGGRGHLRGRVQIADLGLARIFQSPSKPLADVERVVVTLWYRAPELLLGSKHYTKAIDIWAVG